MNRIQSPTNAAPTWQPSNLIWGLLGLFLMGYGLVALNAGTKVSPVLNGATQNDETVDYIIEQAEKGVAMQDRAESEVLPFWINVIARLESSEYIHGRDSIMETERHYYTMSVQKRHALSMHMMLGLVIMASGFFQFWPAFRRRHRRAHRLLGALYIGAAMTSMGMSGYYLWNNPIADTYSEFVFYVGLWFLLILSVVSICIASVAIFKRNIAAHMGWQALAFGCFLTAPVQRSLWVGLSPLSDGASFNEMNIAINVALIGLACLVAYLVFYLNRESSPRRDQVEPPPTRTLLAALLGIGCLAAWGLAVMFYVTSPGLAGSAFTRNLTPAAAMQLHDTVTSTRASWLLMAALAVFLLNAGRVLLAPGDTVKSMSGAWRLSLAAGMTIAVIYLLWAVRLGMPSHEHSLAGSFYGAVSALLLLFLGLISHGVRSRQFEKAREWLWFALMLACAPSIMYMMMFVMAMTHFVPEKYALLGHGYQAAAAVAVGLPIILGHLLAVYSPLTKRYAVN